MLFISRNITGKVVSVGYFCLLDWLFTFGPSKIQTNWGIRKLRTNSFTWEPKSTIAEFDGSWPCLRNRNFFKPDPHIYPTIKNISKSLVIAAKLGNTDGKNVRHKGEEKKILLMKSYLWISLQFIAYLNCISLSGYPSRMKGYCCD